MSQAVQLVEKVGDGFSATQKVYLIKRIVEKPVTADAYISLIGL